MQDKENLTPIAIIILTCLFVIISAAVYLTKGKSKFWIAKKIKIGAMLLTVSSIVPSCSCYDDSYEYPMIPSFSITTSDFNDVPSVNLNVDNTIKGTINDRTGTEFYFSLTDTLYTDTLQYEKILPLDGAFDSDKENFMIEIDENTNSGLYSLNFYTKLEDEPINHLCTRFRIRILK